MHQETVAEKWHRESQELGWLEGALAITVLFLGLIVFIFVGAFTVQETYASETDEVAFVEIVDRNYQGALMEAMKTADEEVRFESLKDVKADIPVEPAVEEVYYYSDGYDPYLNNNLAYLDYGSYSYGNDYGNPFKGQGVAYLGDTEFNWYSQNVMPGGGLTELNENGRHVDEATGFIMDGDGYIAVASPYGVDPVGTVIDTPYGQGKVYDSNNGPAYDMYTDF